MFQNYYDSKNDRFIIAPLRCGSSYTEQLANTLKWSKLREVFHDEWTPGVDNSENKYMGQSDAVQILYLLNHEKYKNSKWVTFVRNPWTRYLSASTMILGSQYGAPNYVLPEEIKLLQENDSSMYGSNHQSIYSDVDAEIQRICCNDLVFDFSLKDEHCVPVLSMQLMMFLSNPKLQLIKLEDMTPFYKEHYPAGDELQVDWYDVHNNNKRNNSDTPTPSTVGIYKRFLETLPYYNTIQAAKLGIDITFNRYIQPEIDIWGWIEEQKGEYNNIDGELLMQELMQDPYFFLRHRKIYQFFIGGAKYINLENSSYIKESMSAIPDIHQELIKNSWLNLKNLSSWG